MGRAPCCEKVGLKRGRWTAEEDEALRKYIEANGEGSWRALPKNAGLQRCGKSCRLRWMNYLRSNLKRGNITAQEEDIIINLHASLGNRWSLIAAHLPGRTDNEIKNYWNSHLSRKIQSFRRCPNPNFIVPLPLVSKPSTKRTKKRATKKNKTTRTEADHDQTHDGKELTANDHLGPIEQEPACGAVNEDVLSGIKDGTLLCLDDAVMSDLDGIWTALEGVNDRSTLKGTNDIDMDGSYNSRTNEGIDNINCITTIPGTWEMSCCTNKDFECSSVSPGNSWELEYFGQDEISSLSWILEDDNAHEAKDNMINTSSTFEIDEEKHNAMVAWLLS